MQLSKHKKYQYLFFLILTIYTIFNGGNSNISIQVNFILFSLLFLFCLNDKNYNLHLINFYKDNQKSILIYLIFIFYLLFQIIPLPIEILKIFSPEKFKIINKLEGEILNSSISLAQSNSFFQILNFITLLIIVFIMKMIFYTDRHKNRFYLFLSILGFLASITAITFYLNGNPDILIFKNSNYKDSSTGFFINRTVFAVFLLFSLVSSLEVLRGLSLSISKRKDNFFLKIYVRLFVIFITIGIITSFSRIGNFLLLITILFYLVNEFFFDKSRTNSLRNIILLILIFDIIILGIYFGSSQIIDRFYFLKDEFAEIAVTNDSLKRFQIIKFALNQLNDYILFGYGAGGFQNLFQIKFTNLNNFYADHAHSDLIEFIGEFGSIGFVLLIISFIKLFLNRYFYNHINLILICFLFVILLFDFSLHIPIIQIMFICFFIVNKKIN
jgi:O-antigen ligase